MSTLYAKVTKTYVAKSGNTIPAGERVEVINVYQYDAVVDYKGTYFSIPRRFTVGIPNATIPE